MHSFKSDEFKIRVLTKDDAEEYNALLRYAFQVTEADLAETGWRDDEIKQSKFPVLERADVLGCFNIIDNKRGACGSVCGISARYEYIRRALRGRLCHKCVHVS